ncbi:hypothetical protein JKF63_03961 [Porcisia hertigi]|uniref:Fungal lipase-type domain-containing protein n=1 Tax=Porcisia hertigi TaxID=2761500 RepID=A0A836IL30_9TRYP|nr:hypothetical protein JKF63_03961 [Porcisia hertigi]
MTLLSGRTLVCVTTFFALPLFFLFMLVILLAPEVQSASNHTAALSAEYDVEEALRALYFSKSTYCPVGSIMNWTCGSACRNASPAFSVYNVYENVSTGNLGFSGLDHKMGRIVLAFRGSANKYNWLEDFDFWFTPYAPATCGEKCRVHRGFYAAYNSIRPQILLDMQAMLLSYPFYTVLVTGHSLGAAMALLAAVEIRSRNFSHTGLMQNSVQLGGAASDDSHLVSLDLYTFGEPRVGNREFANWSASVLENGRQFRVTHARDPVPHVPPMCWGFTHVPQEIWYPDDNDTVVYCQDTPTTEDPHCSNSFNETVPADHDFYLGLCTRCECTPAEMEEISKYELPNPINDMIACDHGRRTVGSVER